ncbi:MAG TPA: hypothetical protein VM120_05165, partial [Bryobacteraceae bacterium]|nr:hypothetical protein [Bryobacteraceae bacterium]
MKCSRRLVFLTAAVSIAVGSRAALPEWVRFVEGGSRVESVFFRSMALPGGSVNVRRPPTETRAELTTLIHATPAQADLYSLRAREAELLLDFGAAEADWKKYAELSKDRLALADYYHRQLRVNEEFRTLAASAANPKTFERMITL